MIEQDYSMKRARPELYIDRLSATVVTVFKLLDGIVAGYALYHIFRLIAPVIAELSKGALDINHALQIVISEYGLPQSVLDAYKGILVGGMALPFIIWGGLLLVVIVGLSLIVIEAIALLSLRITQKGAWFIKVIHQIYMGVCIVYLLLFVYSIIEYYRFSRNIQTSSVKTGYDILFIIYGVIYLVILLLHLCYHKDIAMAMSTVMYEVETGTQGELRRTHLSGISFLFGLPYAIVVLSLVLDFAGLIKGTSSLKQYNLSNMQYISIIGIPAIMMIKHLSICFCNRNLKRAR